MTPSPEEVRAFVLERIEEPLRAKQLAANEIPDDFDLFLEGMIDSFGIVELVAELEERYGAGIDLDALDAEELTVVGPLSRYVAAQLEAAS